MWLAVHRSKLVIAWHLSQHCAYNARTDAAADGCRIYRKRIGDSQRWRPSAQGCGPVVLVNDALVNSCMMGCHLCTACCNLRYSRVKSCCGPCGRHPVCSSFGRHTIYSKCSIVLSTSTVPSGPAPCMACACSSLCCTYSFDSCVNVIKAS